MNELSVSEFKKAIHATHCVSSELIWRVPIKEFFQGKPAWEGEVLVFVFGLHEHPTAPKCYAWSVDGRVTAVLHEGPVDSPQAAVRAAIAAEHRQ